jgi:hypothetical protein
LHAKYQLQFDQSFGVIKVSANPPKIVESEFHARKDFIEDGVLLILHAKCRIARLSFSELMFGRMSPMKAMDLESRLHPTLKFARGAKYNHRPARTVGISDPEWRRVRHGDKPTLKRVLCIGFKKETAKTQISTGDKLRLQKWNTCEPERAAAEPNKPGQCSKRSLVFESSTFDIVSPRI